MSRGIGATARVILEDEKTIIYEYGSYNWNDPEHYNDERICDGIIMVSKEAFIEPEIQEKIKRSASGRKKLVIKKIYADVDYEELFRSGRLVVENCSNCWSKTNDDFQIDMMAMHILFQIFHQYQKTGELLKIVGYHV